MGSTCECNVFQLDNEVIIDLFQIYDQCMRIHVCVNNNPTKNLTRDLEWWTHVCARSLRVVSTKNVLTASLASTPAEARGNRCYDYAHAHDIHLCKNTHADAHTCMHRLVCAMRHGSPGFDAKHSMVGHPISLLISELAFDLSH